MAKQIVSVEFKSPRQFIGIDGVDSGRVFNGLVHDTPLEVVESAAFAIYKKDETALVLSEAKDVEVEAEVEAEVEKKPKGK